MGDSVFRIWFSGLVHFVQNRDPNARCRMCVVIPLAENHLAEIYRVKRITDDCNRPRIIKDGDPILSLNKHRISFKLSQADDLIPESTLESTFDFGVMQMYDITGAYADEYSEIVGLNPPSDVVAQILLESDVIRHDTNLSVLREWELPGTLTGNRNSVTLADPVFVEISDVRSVKLRVYSFGDDPKEPPKREIPLAGDGEKIEIFIQNRCERKEGDPPFGRLDVRRGPNRVTIVQVDEDFEYNYKMLNPATQTAIEKVLPKDQQQKARYPLPESLFFEIKFSPHLCVKLPDVSVLQEIVDQIGKYIPLGTGSGSGSDCLGSKGIARFMDLEAFLPPLAPLPTAAMKLAQSDRIRPTGPTVQQSSGESSSVSSAAPSKKAPN